MLVGGVGGAVMVLIFLLQVGRQPSFGTLAVIVSLISVTLSSHEPGWPAFTETVVAPQPRRDGVAGLAVLVWLCGGVRRVSTVSVNAAIQAE